MKKIHSKDLTLKASVKPRKKGFIFLPEKGDFQKRLFQTVFFSDF